MSGVVLLNALGRPEPSPEVSRRLKAIHEGLHLRWVSGVEGHWAVCLTFQPDDRRWELVQTGEIPPDKAFEIIGFLPMDCGPDEAPPYLERSFRTFPKDYVQNMTSAMEHWNTSAVQQAVETAIGEVLDMPDPSSVAPRKRGRPRKVG